MRPSTGVLRPDDTETGGFSPSPRRYFFAPYIRARGGRGAPVSRLRGLVTVRECLNLGRSSWRGIRELQNGEGLKTSYQKKDSNKSNVSRPRGEAGTLVPAGGVPVPAVSLNGYREGFFDGVTAVGAMSKGSIGFQNHDQSLFQIPFSFSQRSTLSIDPGNFFHGGDIPLAVFHVDRCELTNHDLSIPVLTRTGNAAEALS